MHHVTLLFLIGRWYQATKSTNQAMAARVDSLKDEMDEALNKVEICKVGVFFAFLLRPRLRVRIG